MHLAAVGRSRENRCRAAGGLLAVRVLVSGALGTVVMPAAGLVTGTTIGRPGASDRQGRRGDHGRCQADQGVTACEMNK